MARTAPPIAELFLPSRQRRMARAPLASRMPSHAQSSTHALTGVTDDPALQAIWDVVSMIPRGSVSTYGAVARAAGLPGRARLAGRALKLAPKDMNLPWHRVVGAGGRIVFPVDSRHYREQARRLRADRVAVKAGRVDQKSLVDAEAF